MKPEEHERGEGRVGERPESNPEPISARSRVNTDGFGRFVEDSGLKCMRGC